MNARALFLVIAASLAASPASAAVRCVNPTGTLGCFNSIQGAVTAAGPLDTIKVGVGVYNKNVVVPAGKDGLRIVGVSKTATILDPSPTPGRALPCSVSV
jgi:pectin methylesterase-like acyl-CoA thioesterase